MTQCVLKFQEEDHKVRAFYVDVIHELTIYSDILSSQIFFLFNANLRTLQGCQKYLDRLFIVH